MNYLLLQIRDADDPIGAQEADVFVRALDCKPEQLQVFDLLSGSPPESIIDSADIALVGGSGNYSAVGDEDWLHTAFATLRGLYQSRKPTFAICWGCQALARALGGETIHDPKNGELGSTQISASEAAASDPLFATLGDTYTVFQGHEDRVSRLPDDAILLASTDRVPIQAYTFADAPIYATQFHPELTRELFLERVRRYPHYVEKITGEPYEKFEQSCGAAEQANDLLRRFVELASSHPAIKP